MFDRKFGAPDLSLPDSIRAPLLAHLADLKQKYLQRSWGMRVGFGSRPALIVIDLAPHWTQPEHAMGSDLDEIVRNACRLLEAARAASLPIFFTTFAYDPATPPTPQNKKLCMNVAPDKVHRFEIDERLGRRPNEKVIRKPYASAFKGTNLHEMLTSCGVDTLIVCGVSTSHCVYATCRDATDSFRVIVPREAVGERCEVMHLVNLLDIDIDLGDVEPIDDVIAQIRKHPRT